MTRGRRGSLALHRMTLSFTTPRRFSPAHKENDMNGTRATRIAAVMVCASTFHLVSTAAPLQDDRQSRPAGQSSQAVGTGRGALAPAFVSPEVLSDRRVVFRVF